MQCLSNLAWAFASLGVEDGPLFESIAARSMAKISEYSQQNLSNTSWAFSAIEVVNMPLMKSLAAESILKSA
jgi:hypothetical protein